VKYPGWVVWITGLPGSGKSVVAHALQRILADRKVESQILSSDELRTVMTPRPRYTKEERDAVYETLAFIARLLSKNHVNVIIDSTGNLRKYRSACRRRVERFAEVYLDCPLETCISREQKRRVRFNAPTRIYEKARTGKSKTVPGVGALYQKPLSPEVTVDTSKLSPAESASRIVADLAEFLFSRAPETKRRKPSLCESY